MNTTDQGCVSEWTFSDRKGRIWSWSGNERLGAFAELAEQESRGLEEKLSDVKGLEIRDDDVMICTFPKTGTHWIWEIVSMVMKGSAEYETNSKIELMIDSRTPAEINLAPSPRVLNCHYPLKFLPTQLFEKKTKIVHVYRNPKDVAVSFYYHASSIVKRMKEPPFQTFSEFLPFITGEYGVYFGIGGSIFQYYIELGKFSQQNQDIILNLRYEDMKKNPAGAVGKVAEFLGKDLSRDIIEEIAEKCSFHNLKEANDTLKKKPRSNLKNSKQHLKSQMYRKGPVGNEKYLSRFYCEEIMNRDFMKIRGNYQQNHFSNIHGSYEPTPSLTKLHCHISTYGEVGDWKNHFTVAENEQFDKLLEKNKSSLKFVYSI